MILGVLVIVTLTLVVVLLRGRAACTEWELTMAALDGINTKLDDQTQAITALSARIPPSVPPGSVVVTQGDIDAVGARIELNTAAIAALAPAPTA